MGFRILSKEEQIAFEATNPQLQQMRLGELLGQICQAINDGAAVNPPPVWGSIIGSISNQSDLVSYIATQVAMSGGAGFIQVASAAMLPSIGANNTLYLAIDTETFYIWNGVTYQALSFTGGGGGSGGTNDHTALINLNAPNQHPISSITNLQTTLNGLVPTSSLGVPSGVATLDATGIVTVAQLPPASTPPTPASFISAVSPNQLGLGADSKLLVTPQTLPVPNDFISTDANNANKAGGDGKIWAEDKTSAITTISTNVTNIQNVIPSNASTTNLLSTVAETVDDLTYTASTKELQIGKVDGTQIGVILPEATTSIPGLMSNADVQSLSDVVSKVQSIEAGGVWRGTFPTYADMETAYPSLDVSGTTWTDNDFVYVVADETQSGSQTAYIVQSHTLVFERVTSLPVQQAQNGTLGVVQGDASTAGKIYVETDGSMSLNGYDSISQAVVKNPASGAQQTVNGPLQLVGSLDMQNWNVNNAGWVNTKSIGAAAGNTIYVQNNTDFRQKDITNVNNIVTNIGVDTPSGEDLYLKAGGGSNKVFINNDLYIDGTTISNVGMIELGGVSPALGGITGLTDPTSAYDAVNKQYADAKGLVVMYKESLTLANPAGTYPLSKTYDLTAVSKGFINGHIVIVGVSEAGGNSGATWIGIPSGANSLGTLTRITPTQTTYIDTYATFTLGTSSQFTITQKTSQMGYTIFVYMLP